MFSIIIPTYNRLNNIKEVIKSIKAQVDPPEYEIIIADDGSTDHTGQYINSLDDPNIKYVWCGPNQGFRPNRTRNIGITHAKYPYIILVDSDVVLNPNALKEHAKIRADQRFTNVVVIGMYHFMDEVDRTSLNVTDWESVIKYVPNKISESPPLAGLDCRIHAFHSDLETIPIITEYDGLGFFGGNQCWPTWLFWALGGYDEKMPSGMGEDAELGQRMRLNNVPVIQYEPVYGVHLWHQRNVRDSMRMVQESIAYIDKKYGIGTYANITEDNPRGDAPVDKSFSVWYTRDMKAKLVKTEDDNTVYAVDGEGKNYVGIPDMGWLTLLGFNWEDVIIVGDDYLSTMTNKGVIKK